MEAKFKVNDIVFWVGAVYRVTARYWRKSANRAVYDLLEVVAHDGRTPTVQLKVRDTGMEHNGPLAQGWRRINGKWEKV